MSSTQTSTQAGAYTCRFCRLPSNASGTSCPNCGAPVDVRAVVSDSGWVEQPAIKDMAKIQFGQSYCQIEGTLVPSADFALSQGDGVVFSHHSLLWTAPETNLEPWSKGSFFKRMNAGMPLVLMRASGPGHVALSEDHPGEVVALPIPPGRAFRVREHSFLALTDNVEFSWENAPVWLQVQSGDETEYEYPIGPYLDVFVARGDRPGLLLLHAPGNLFVREPRARPGHLGAGRILGLRRHFGRLQPARRVPCQRRDVLAQFRVPDALAPFTGPGRVAVRSIFEKPERYSGVVYSSGMTYQRW